MSLARTGFKRKAFERSPRPPIVPVVGQRGVIRQVSQEVVACPKEIIIRSRAYRLYTASQECFLCRLVGYSQAAHENVGKGKAMKVCDSRIFPACGPHHGLIGCYAQFDLALDGLTRDERRELGGRLVVQMQARARCDGWRFTDTEIVKP